MLKTDVFVWLTVNCKSLNFCSVDTLSAQLHCHMDYFIYCRHANSTHLPYSSFARNFEFSNLVIRILRSTKSQKFTILMFYYKFYSPKSGGPWLPGPPGFAAAELCKELNLTWNNDLMQAAIWKHQLYNDGRFEPFTNPGKILACASKLKALKFSP